jgi:hypothetical protein
VRGAIPSRRNGLQLHPLRGFVRPASPASEHDHKGAPSHGRPSNLVMRRGCGVRAPGPLRPGEAAGPYRSGAIRASVPAGPQARMTLAPWMNAQFLFP